MLHVMGLPSGKDIQKPAPFLPANSHWSDPIAVGTMLYTSTSGGCGGAPDAVWAIDLASESKPVISWKSDGPIVGSLALTTDGTLLVATTSTIVALDSKTLTVARTFGAPGSQLVTGPAILRQGDLELVAVAAKNGHVNITRAGDAGSPWLPVGPVQLAVDALATWQDATNAPLVLVPTDHSVVASGINDSGGARWTAVNLTMPATPIIVNGVVFVLEGGATAVLHAYDGTTGKEFWTSGKTITAAAAPGSFWSANGQIYVGAMDGTLYAFGFTDERR
jgi:glucose dehydrogenase